jgi:hypothetical protein
LLIKIIRATPGPSTTERILDLINAHPEGITIAQLSHRLNRPISMLNHCLKPLISAEQVSVRLSDSGMQQVYFPNLLVSSCLVSSRPNKLVGV